MPIKPLLLWNFVRFFHREKIARRGNSRIAAAHDFQAKAIFPLNEAFRRRRESFFFALRPDTIYDYL
jgi:hypothetical protein